VDNSKAVLAIRCESEGKVNTLSARPPRRVISERGYPLACLAEVLATPAPAKVGLIPYAYRFNVLNAVQFCARVHLAGYRPSQVHGFVSRNIQSHGAQYLFALCVCDDTARCDIIVSGDEALYFMRYVFCRSRCVYSN
jgi:hypothetical protein